MNERLARTTFLPYELRPEYDIHASAELYPAAFDALEGLLDTSSDRANTISQTVEGRVARRHLQAYTVGERASIETDVLLEDYHSGPLRRLGAFTLKEFIGKSKHPLKREYHLEMFVGGGVQGQIATLDVVKGRGLDTRPIAPYDIKNLLEDIRTTEELLQEMEENYEL